MKISVFFDIYCPYHENKDPGQIPLGVLENGVDTSIITINKPELTEYQPKFELIQKQLSEFYSEEFWRKDPSNAILAYPLQGMSYSPLIAIMKAAGKKVLLKFDSDGRIAYPLQRHTHRIPLRERLTFEDIASEVYWRIAPVSLKYRKHAGFVAEVIKQIELADGAIIESPLALDNVRLFLSAWNRSDLAQKVIFIPNPVTPEFVEGAVGKKENLAIAHGRWDDYQVKNTATMVASAVDFLKERSDWRFIVFGSGMDLVKKHLTPVSSEVKSRFTLSEFIPHSVVKDKLAPAKMLFVPSRWESFSLAAAEAVCSGCSVVGTPAEALQYLSNGGASGTIAADFKRKAISAALVEDAAKWDSGSYDPEKIAAYWRPKLDRKTIAKSILDLVTDKRA